MVSCTCRAPSDFSPPRPPISFASNGSHSAVLLLLAKPRHLVMAVQFAFPITHSKCCLLDRIPLQICFDTILWRLLKMQRLQCAAAAVRCCWYCSLFTILRFTTPSPLKILKILTKSLKQSGEQHSHCKVNPIQRGAAYIFELELCNMIQMTLTLCATIWISMCPLWYWERDVVFC